MLLLRQSLPSWLSSQLHKSTWKLYIISDCIADFRAQPLLHPCPTRCAPLASGAASAGTARQDREGTEFPALVCSKSCEQEFLSFKRTAVREQEFLAFKRTAVREQEFLAFKRTAVREQEFLSFKRMAVREQEFLSFKRTAVREQEFLAFKRTAVREQEFLAFKRTAVRQQQFSFRRQLASEPTAAYSHALVELADRICRLAPKSAAERDLMLREQFVENVRDVLLRWELKRRVEADDRPTSWRCAEAMLWSEEVEDAAHSKVRSQAVEASVGRVEAGPDEGATSRADGRRDGPTLGAVGCPAPPFDGMLFVLSSCILVYHLFSQTVWCL